VLVVDFCDAQIYYVVQVGMPLITFDQIVLQIIQSHLSIHVGDEDVLRVWREFTSAHCGGRPTLGHHCLYTSSFVQVPEAHVAVVG